MWQTRGGRCGLGVFQISTGTPPVSGIPMSDMVTHCFTSKPMHWHIYGVEPRSRTYNCPASPPGTSVEPLNQTILGQFPRLNVLPNYAFYHRTIAECLQQSGPGHCLNGWHGVFRATLSVVPVLGSRAWPENCYRQQWIWNKECPGLMLCSSILRYSIDAKNSFPIYPLRFSRPSF